MLGQFVDDLDTRQLSRQYLTFSSARHRGNDFLFSIADQWHRLTFRLIEQCKLRRIGLRCLLGLTPEQVVAQQLDLSFQVDDVSLISLGNFFLAIECLKQHVLEQNGVIRKIVGQRNHGPDYTGSGYVARS